MNPEEALIRSFVAPARRERLVLLLANPKRRRDATATLAHFGDLDPRWVVALRPDLQMPASIERELRRRGAGDDCHVISEDVSVDGKQLRLSEALAHVVGRGHGTLISCISGKLGYYEGEGPSDRCILTRKPR